MKDSPDPEAAAVAHEIRVSIIRLARRIRVERDVSDLSTSLLSVIALLTGRGPLSLSELSELERVTPPAMTRTVTQLIAAGYVRRERSAEDGRRAYIELTDEGRELSREIRTRRDLWFSSRVDELSDTERELLYSALPVLRKLADS